MEYALKSNFGYLNNRGLRDEHFAAYSFEKLKHSVNLLELSFLKNICAKHNLSPQEVLEKYNVVDAHWQCVAYELEKKLGYHKDSIPQKSFPDYGNKDLVVIRNKALQDVLNIFNSPKS